MLDKQKPCIIYQLKVTVKGIDPIIWRRIQIRSDITLVRLHRIMQMLMDWSSYHLYQYQIADKTHGPKDIDDDVYGYKKSVSIKMKNAFHSDDSITYEYDFGDGWEINILLEKILPARIQAEDAICIDGARHGPVEDSGGPFGYQDKLNILKNKNHPEYKEIRNWIGKKYDPEEFNLAEMNLILSKGYEEYIRKKIGA